MPTRSNVVDQAGRQYSYDEHNRLKQIKNASNVVLANYTYDALGRRVTFNDPVVVATTRYYYDGQSVIEERNAGDVRVRYHINGNQYIDEHVATFTQATSAFTYYLTNANYSIAGSGNPDGSVIERLDYSSTGDFAGGGPGALAFYHDADGDLDLDLRDFANFQNCFDPTPPVTPACATVHDFDISDASDGDIDLADYARWSQCSRGPFVTPDQACGIPTNTAGLPVSGAFTLHGRPADILSDGHALLDFRARVYLPQLGRWLQRDPVAYNDGFNLYEPFRGNPMSNLDPLGEGFLTWWFNNDYQQSDADFVRGFFAGAATASGNVAIGAAKGARELAYTAVDIVVAPVDIASTLIFNEPLGRPLSQVGQAATNPDSLGRLIATTGSRNVLNAVTAGGFNVVEGTVIYVQTGDAEALSQNVGGQGLLTLATVGAVQAAPGIGSTTTDAVRVRVLGNIAESQAARAASRFEVFAAQEAALPALTARGGALPVRIGQAGVVESALAFERAGFVLVGREITMQTTAARTRLDLLVEAPRAGGIVPGTTVRMGPLQQFFVEVKTGSGRVSANQQAAFRLIRTQGGIPMGLRAELAGLEVGEQSGAFEVFIIRR